MAIKWLDAKRLQGTNAERLALTNTPTRQSYRINSEEYVTESSPKLNFTVPTGDIASETTGFAGDTLTFDLGSTLSDTEWVARVELTFTSMTENTNSSVMNGGSLWISDTADGNVEDAQDWCSFVGYQSQNSTEFLGLNVRNNVAPESSFTNGSSVLGSLSSTTYYVQLERDNDVSTMTVTTNSDYTTGTSTGTITQADVTGLRYLKITGFTEYRSTFTNGTVVGSFQNLKICDTVTTYDDDDVTYDLTTILASINPSLPNGTIFNETDAYKYFMFDGTDTWNQMVSS